MGILDDGKVSGELERGVRRVRAAKSGLEEAARGRVRARSDAKTRKSAATREKIMAAATELMVENNGTEFQMSEVSARCHMSKGSLYYYFADKDALVQAIFDREVDELTSRVESAVANAPSALASITQLALVLADGMRPGSPLALAVTRELLDSKNSVLPSVETRLARIISIFEAQFDRAKAEGLMRPEVSSRLAAISVAGAFTFSIFEKPAAEDLSDSEDFSAQLIELMLKGMATPSGQDAFEAVESAKAAAAGAEADAPAGTSTSPAA